MIIRRHKSDANVKRTFRVTHIKDLLDWMLLM